MDWEFGVGRCKLSHVEWINKVLLYSTGNYIQYPVINHNTKEYLKNCIYVYNRVTLLYSRDWQNIVNQLYFNKKKSAMIESMKSTKKMILLVTNLYKLSVPSPAMSLKVTNTVNRTFKEPKYIYY